MTEENRPPAVAETWMFCGTRIKGKGTRYHAWLPLPADDLSGEMLFDPDKGSSYAVGSEYAVMVRRDSEHVWKVGNPGPRYLGRHENEGLRALAEARHKAIEAVIRVKRMEGADKRDSALEDALEPLVKLSAGIHYTERTAFLAYVIQKITKPW